MKMKMKNNYVLIEELVQERTPSGIYLPQNKHNRVAKILAVDESDDDLTVGDIILKLIGKGTEIRMEGKYVEAIHRNNILAVIK